MVSSVSTAFKSEYHAYYSQRSKELAGNGLTSREIMKIISKEWKEMQQNKYPEE